MLPPGGASLAQAVALPWSIAGEKQDLGLLKQVPAYLLPVLTQMGAPTTGACGHTSGVD